jgi:hypothetical protein
MNNVSHETLNISEEENINIDNIHLRKMIFIYNALNDGWNVKKSKDSYIFSKNHEKKKEIFLDSYLASFMKDNLNINNFKVT